MPSAEVHRDDAHLLQKIHTSTVNSVKIPVTTKNTICLRAFSQGGGKQKGSQGALLGSTRSQLRLAAVI